MINRHRLGAVAIALVAGLLLTLPWLRALLPERTEAIAEQVHRDRIERGELRQDLAPLLMDLSRQRLESAQETP